MELDMAGEKARRKGYLLIEIKLHAWCVAKWTEKYVSYISGTSKCVEIQLLPSSRKLGSETEIRKCIVITKMYLSESFMRHDLLRCRHSRLP